MFVPNATLIGTLSKMSLGIVASFLTREQRHTKLLTVEPIGVVVEMKETDEEEIAAGYEVPGANPIIGAIEPDAARVSCGARDVVGSPPDKIFKPAAAGSDHPVGSVVGRTEHKSCTA
jgi:hypothetical protein